MKKVYIVIEDYCIDFEEQRYTTLFSTEEKARDFMNEKIKEIKEESNCDTKEVNKNSFETYNEGYYSEYHLCVELEEKEVL